MARITLAALALACGSAAAADRTPPSSSGPG